MTLDARVASVCSRRILVASCRTARGYEAHTPSPRASTACQRCRSPHPWASSAEVPRGRRPAGYGSVLAAVGAPSTVIFIPLTPTRMLTPRLVPVRLMTTPC